MKHLTWPVINGGSRKASLRRKLGLHETKLVLQESGGDSSEGFSFLCVCFSHPSLKFSKNEFSQRSVCKRTKLTLTPKKKKEKKFSIFITIDIKWALGP